MTLVLYIPYLAVILFSAIMAFVFRKAIREKKLAILTPYLFLVFVQELCLFLADRYRPDFSNTIIYNIYRPISAIVFTSIYYFIPFMAPLRKMMLWILGIYLLASFFTYAFVNSLFEHNGYLILMRGFVISCCAIFFLFRFFHLDNREEEKFWSPLLWITLGVIIFYPVISISVVFQKYLSDYNARVGGFRLYHLIPQALSIFMYSCFSYAFYLCKKNWT